MTKTRMMLGTLVITSLLFAGVALAAAIPSIDWWVIGGSGGSASAGSYSLDGTVGQAVAGTDSNGDIELCAGFWCRPAEERHEIYLPLTLQNYV